MNDLKALMCQASVLLSLSLFMPVTVVMASDFYFKCQDVESGLSQNSVYDIIQDSYDRVLTATGGGTGFILGRTASTHPWRSAEGSSFRRPGT